MARNPSLKKEIASLLHRTWYMVLWHWKKECSWMFSHLPGWIFLHNNAESFQFPISLGVRLTYLFLREYASIKVSGRYHATYMFLLQYGDCPKYIPVPASRRGHVQGYKIYER